ncbi:MAG: DUF3237 domain-containing protein [Ktedonobacteraceae bacterium]|nr:DUF3237 domain-containing protein [Ktedonobacteraceae bacterium]MBO0795970.1 DUF3237 domain-containing protein [Ktedonobacteraceae bacterium]
MALDLIPLCIMTSTPLPPTDLGMTSSGRRLMVTIQESIWEGERLRAKLKPGTVAADWMVIGPDGTAHIEIRLTLETHDGALIYVHYTGRRDFTQVSQGIDAPVYITPLFETSDERYLWLNKIQAVGKGTVNGNKRIYHIYELR